jgi:hypothetical protein
MQSTFKYIINIICILCFVNIANAQNTSTIDSTKAPIDTVVKNKSFIAKVKTSALFANSQPKALYVGIDAAKLVYNLLDSNRLRIETYAELFLKNKNWITANVGFANAKFSSTALQYSSQSSGVLVGYAKSLFPFISDKDMDNAFIGFGYGFALNRVGEATYTISDIWGTTTGITPANTNVAHFAELDAGFRMAITKRFMLGWRIQGKTILNAKVFKTIAPIYIANYGAGDKSTIFGYNLMATWRIW